MPGSTNASLGKEGEGQRGKRAGGEEEAVNRPMTLSSEQIGLRNIRATSICGLPSPLSDHGFLLVESSVDGHFVLLSNFGLVVRKRRFRRVVLEPKCSAAAGAGENGGDLVSEDQGSVPLRVKLKGLHCTWERERRLAPSSLSYSQLTLITALGSEVQS